VNIAGSELIVNPGIGKIGQVIDGIIEIKIVVVHAVHEFTQIIDPGHGEAAFENVGMLEERICSMIGAKGSAHGSDGHLGLAMIPDERNDFFAQIGIENGLHIAAMERMRCFVVKTEAIDGIDGIKFDAAGVDEFGERADHALAFQFKFVAGAGGKTNDGRAVMAIGNDAEFEAETRRVPTMIFALHSFELRQLSMPAELNWGNGTRH
jgi:hypothetical protein